MLTEVEELFAAAAPTPKGRRALRAIFRATRETVAAVGIEAASLDAIADRAGLTQAALRHYFPTRDDLLSAYFVKATEWFRGRTEAVLADEALGARDKLERCIAWHLEFMEGVDTLFWLEASAFWLRRAGTRRLRDAWYRWLCDRYAALIGQIQPAVSRSERERRAYLVLTLVLGGWITHGRGSAVDHAVKGGEQRQLLVDAALDLAIQ